MNSNPKVTDASRDAGLPVAMGFVLGAVVGAGIALLLAPGTGRETRQRLAAAGRRWGGAARGKLGHAQATGNDFKQETKPALQAREGFEHGPKSHELPVASGTEVKVSR